MMIEHKKAIAKVLIYGKNTSDIVLQLQEPLVMVIEKPLLHDQTFPPGLGKKAVELYIEQFMTEGTRGFLYTYGDRAVAHFGYSQIEHCVRALKKDPLTRRAVITYMDPREDDDKELPCLQLIQFWRNAKGQLETRAVFRSHDIFGAWFVNCKAIAELTKQVASRVDMPVGPMTVISLCPHIYLTDQKIATEYAKDQFPYPHSKVY